MDRVTRSNAASAEESASTAEELDAQAIVFSGAAGDLLGIVGGHATSDTPATPARRILRESHQLSGQRFDLWSIKANPPEAGP
jgi:hypothetical protein